MLPLLFSAVVSSPALPSVPVPPAPIIIGVGPPIRIPASELLVEIRANGNLLWAGPMRVAEGSSASFNQQKNDATRTDCALEQPEYFGAARSSLSVNLNAVRYGQDASGYQIRVS